MLDDPYSTSWVLLEECDPLVLEHMQGIPISAVVSKPTEHYVSRQYFRKWNPPKETFHPEEHENEVMKPKKLVMINLIVLSFDEPRSCS